MTRESTPDSHAGAQHFSRTLERVADADGVRRILVAGCGLGHEASFIHAQRRAEVVGIEPELADAARARAEPGLRFVEASVLDMPFADATFDAVFYHHVIEHVPDAEGSLREIARVLRPGGWLYVGTPNRHRVAGYIGSFDAHPLEKLRWNLADYRERLRGRFHNELGAHAGFSEAELRDMLARHFATVRFLTGDYLSFKYGRRLPATVLRAVCSRPLIGVVAPAVYAICRL